MVVVLGGSQVCEMLLFFLWQHFRNLMSKSSATAFLSPGEEGRMSCSCSACASLGFTEAILIRNKAFICPTLCFYTAIPNTTSSQYSCWIAVDFGMKSPLIEKMRVVGDLVMRIKFCPCWRLLRNSSKKKPLQISTCCSTAMLPYVLCIFLCNGWPKVIWTVQLVCLPGNTGRNGSEDLMKKSFLFSQWCYKNNMLQITLT